ncbi:MAG TPA: ABC transporter ATP-binding protein [Mycobacteriales bacterium]|nr:ABC transporter ATP-binding protein [Mycobacteriales bacterium]
MTATEAATSALDGPARPLLELNNVEVRYQGTILALKGISLQIRSGEVLGLLGPNGAGKTTLLRAISNLLAPQKGRVSEGTITFNGSSIVGCTPTETVNRGVVQVLEGRRVLEHLTVEQNLRAAAAAVKLRRSETADAISDTYSLFPKLAVLRTRSAGYLSGGEQQMLVLGRALITRPKLLLLDEPSLGLSPVMTDFVFETIRVLNTRGLTILVVEQNAHHTLAISDRGHVLDTGRIVLSGTSEELRRNPDLQEFYLGLNRDGARRDLRETKNYKRRRRWLG